MNLQEILNELRTGKTLRLRFSTQGEREKFRVALYRVKKTEDKALSDVLDEDRMTLKWEPEEKEAENESGPVTIYTAKIWLENKPSDTNYEVEIVED